MKTSLILLTLAVAMSYGHVLVKRGTKRNAVISDFIAPNCKNNGNSIDCCTRFTWLNKMRYMCIKMTYVAKKPEMSVSLMFDGKRITRSTMQVGETCGQLPGKLKKNEACLHTYYLRMNKRRPIVSFEACYIVKIANLLQFRFNCVKVPKDGSLVQHKKIQPENVDKNGKIKNTLIIDVGVGVGQVAGVVLDEVGKLTSTIGSHLIDIFG